MFIRTEARMDKKISNLSTAQVTFDNLIEARHAYDNTISVKILSKLLA